MLNSTINVASKLDMGIISTPSNSFLNGTKQDIVLKGTDIIDKQVSRIQDVVKRCDSFDYSFDKMPI